MKASHSSVRFLSVGFSVVLFFDWFCTVILRFGVKNPGFMALGVLLGVSKSLVSSLLETFGSTSLHEESGVMNAVNSCGRIWLLELDWKVCSKAIMRMNSNPRINVKKNKYFWYWHGGHMEILSNYLLRGFDAMTVSNFLLSFAIRSHHFDFPCKIIHVRHFLVFS